MKRLPAIALSLLVSGSVLAQNAPQQPAYYVVHEEVARPGMVAQFESVTRDLFGAFAAQNVDPKVFGMNTYQIDFHYLFISPIPNFGALDMRMRAWNSVGAAMGADKWRALMGRAMPTVESWDDWIMVRRGDLSYVPADPRINSNETRFVHLTYYYVDPAHIGDAEQVAKDYVALFKAKNIAEAFTTWQVVFGNDTPLYLVAAYGKSPLDFYTANEQVNAAIRAEAGALEARALGASRKVESRDAVYRPDLSFPLPAAK